MIFDSLTVGPFAENTYLVGDAHTSECVLIDPGDEGSGIIQMVRRSKCDLREIWLTHAHLDHIGAVAAVKRVWDVPIFLHPLDRKLYENAHRQAAFYGLPFDSPPPPDRDLAEGDEMRVGSLSFAVLHVPGHAPGHVIFVGDEIILGGDLLFMDSIGRTDLPMSSPQDMARSLDRVAALPPQLRVYPGHGPATTIARELASNPFLNGLARVIGS